MMNRVRRRSVFSEAHATRQTIIHGDYLKNITAMFTILNSVQKLRGTVFARNHIGGMTKDVFLMSFRMVVSFGLLTFT